MNEEEALEIFKNLILLPYDWKITDKYKGTINFIGAVEGNEAIEIISNLIEKLQKENEELKEKLKEENELNKIIKDTKLNELFCKRNGKKVESAIKLRDELLKLPEGKLYGIKKCKKSVVLITKEEVIPVQKVKDKIEEIDEKIKHEENEKVVIYLHKRKRILQELLEGRK